jgi:acetylxylan esterase
MQPSSETTPTETASPRRWRRIALFAGVGSVAAASALIVGAAMAGPAGAVASSGSGCASVSIITARASTEAAGEGITGALVTQIVNASAQTVSRASVSYPATLGNYAGSSLQGINALKTQLTNLVNSCPNTKVVLLGYSQGAHVVLDVIGGGQGGSLGTATAPIATNIATHVQAIATFGDPRHVVNQSFDLGTSTTNGLFPRSQTQLNVLAPFAPRIQAYCDANDEFCASGASLQVHLSYLNRYQNAASSFVLGKVGG